MKRKKAPEKTDGMRVLVDAIIDLGTRAQKMREAIEGYLAGNLTKDDLECAVKKYGKCKSAEMEEGK